MLREPDEIWDYYDYATDEPTEEEPEGEEDLLYKYRQEKSESYKCALRENPQDTVTAYNLGLNDIEMCWTNNQADKGWRNYDICREIPDYIPLLLSSSNPYYYKTGIEICTNAAYSLGYHHRLKLKLFQLYTEACANHNQEQEEYVISEVERLSTNIQNWDSGHPELIVYSENEDRDPIEWSPQYEAVIHLALEKVNRILRNEPRKLGFCHRYWRTLKSVLRKDYGIEWRDSSDLNSQICYD